MGVFLRSPHAHAVIKGIDTKAAALAMPGVVAVFTGEDLRPTARRPALRLGRSRADGTPMKEPPHPALAQGKVRYVGDAVAFVIADTLEQAREAAEAIEVDYEALPAVVGVLDAIRPGAAAVFDDIPDNICCRLGAAATPRRRRRPSRNAAHVARISLVNNRLVGNPMEPRAAIGEYDAGTRPLHDVDHEPVPAHRQGADGRTSCSTSRSTSCASWRPMSAAASASSSSTMPRRRSSPGPPRKVEPAGEMGSERSEGFISDAHGRDHVTEAELALDENGKFLGLRVAPSPTWAAICRRSVRTSRPISTALLLAGVYTTPAIYCEVKGVFTNTLPVDAYRGAGPSRGDLPARAAGRCRGQSRWASTRSRSGAAT